MNTWHKISTTLFGEGDPETLSAYADYDLSTWLLGVSVDIDESWCDVSIYVGPFELSLVYWRKEPTTDEGS